MLKIYPILVHSDVVGDDDVVGVAAEVEIFLQGGTNSLHS